MTREEFYDEFRMELVQRFKALSVEEKNIMRENIDSELAFIYKKILGDELMSGIPKLRPDPFSY